MNTAKKIGNPNATNKRVTTAGMDREIALGVNAFKRDARYSKAVAGGRVKFRDTTLYIAFDAAGFGGKQALLTPNTKKLVGITNFDADKLNTGRNVCISAARLLYSTEGASLQTADWYNNDRLCPELQNSEVVITQAGVKVFSIGLTDLFGHKFSDFRQITDRPLLHQNEPINIEIQTPDGVTVPTATAQINQFCRLEFRVIESKN